MNGKGPKGTNSRPMNRKNKMRPAVIYYHHQQFV